MFLHASSCSNIRKEDEITMKRHLVISLADLFILHLHYRLFKPVDENHAKLLVILGALVSVPIMFLNVFNEIAALTLDSGVLSCQHSKRVNWTPWRCCSSICMMKELMSPQFFGG